MPEITITNFYYSFQPLGIVREAYLIPLNKPLFEGVAYWKAKFHWTLDTTTTVLLSTVLNLKKLTSLDFDYKPRRLFEGRSYRGRR